MEANGLVTLVLVAVVAGAAIALARRLFAEDPDDASFEHWMLDVGGMKPIPPVHAQVREAIGPWRLEPEQAAIGAGMSGRVLAVATARGWSLLVERSGPAPKELDGLPVQVGTHGWLAITIRRDDHLGTADEAMAWLWQAASPLIRGPGPRQSSF